MHNYETKEIKFIKKQKTYHFVHSLMFLVNPSFLKSATY